MITIREARKDDNEALLELTKACPMNGHIGIRIDREPNFFELLKAKKGFKIFIAKSDERIVGSFALVSYQGFIHSESTLAGYLCDLKIHPEYRRKPIAYLLMKKMLQYMRSTDIHYFLCITASGNKEVERLLMGRLGIPEGTKIASFTIFQWLPRKKAIKDAYIVRYNPESHHTACLTLLCEYYRNYQFATAFDIESDLTSNQAWVYIQEGRIVAFLSLMDMTPVKQNRVIMIPTYLKVGLRLLKVLRPGLKIPKEGDVISLINIQHLAYAEGYHNQAFKLVQNARHYIYGKGYTFLSYGMDVRNEFIKFGKRPKHISFHSNGFLLTTKADLRWDKQSKCHFDFHLV